MYSNNKQILDTIIAIVGLIITLPILLVVGISIKMSSHGPVLFKQVRTGRNFKNFQIYKFRTMTNEKHQVKKYIGKADGVTKIGFYLRRYKIDEIPQLINVIKGEMSLVGPRPGVPDDIERMSEKTKNRYKVRPGITGLAQVSGNIFNSWEKRYEYDLKYVENMTLINDIRIIIRTFKIIIEGEEKFVDKPLKLV